MKKKNVETWPSEGKEETVPAFTGFWKVFGVVGTFLVGVILFWWGGNIMIYHWANIREAMGPIGHMALMPLAVGFILTVFSAHEFFRIVRREVEI